MVFNKVSKNIFTEKLFSSLTNLHIKVDNQGHVPVMLENVIDLFQKLKPKSILDLTFGGGGHSKELLIKLPSLQTIYTLDRDPQAYQRALLLAEKNPKVKPLKGKFSQLKKLLSSTHDGLQLDGCLLDAGLSSIQLAEAHRGFSLSKDGPLDMRMDENSDPKQLKAYDVVNYMSEERLNYIIKRYGEEKRSRLIAKAIVDHRNLYGNIETTFQLANVISSIFPENAYRKDKLGRNSHVATKTFQAIRIFVNDEINELQMALDNMHKLLRPGGLAVVITFHSLEDRIVKRHFQDLEINHNSPVISNKFSPKSSISSKVRFSATPSYDVPKLESSGLSVMSLNKMVDKLKLESVLEKRWKLKNRGVVLPTDKEVIDNPRARSAKMRYAYKSSKNNSLNLYLNSLC